MTEPKHFPIKPFLDELDSLAATLTDLALEKDAAHIKQACTDWRKRYHTQALVLIQPSTVESLQAVVRLCAKHGIAMCTQGGNTGLVGGAVPVAQGPHAGRPHVLISTRGLRESLELNPTNLTLIASAGFTLQEVQDAAQAHGLLFPLSLASEGSCSIGGNLASNAGGVAVLRYGNARELCLSLEYVNAQGELCGDVRGLRKNNTGYDLRHLLIGSEGTLGIITRACLKVYPAPTATVTAWLNVKSIHSAVAVLQATQRRFFDSLSSYEWMNAQALTLVSSHFNLKPPLEAQHTGCDHVLLEFASLGSNLELLEQVQDFFSALLAESGLEAKGLGLLNVFIAQSLAEAGSLWALRENISEAQAKEGLNVKHDVACAVSKLPEFHDSALAAIEAMGLDARPILFGHLGDGNLHFNVSAPVGGDSQAFLHAHQEELNRLVHGEIIKAGGTVSAEHGVGQLKLDLVRDITHASDYQAMLAIKQALDPQNLLNPGKLLDRTLPKA